MADVDLTIRARNEASDILRQFSQDVTRTAQSVEFSMRGLAQLAGVGAAIIGVVEGARAIASVASQGIKAYDDLNRSAIKLSETLQLVPNGSKQAADDLKKLAGQLETLTNTDAARIMEQMGNALRRGASASAIEDMTEAAIGLSRVFDKDLATSMRMVEDATKGNFDAFAGLIPGINELATTEEKLAAVSQLATTGLINKANSARDAIEAGDALRIATKNLYEAFGELLSPIRDVVYRGFIVMFDFIRTQLMPAMEDLKSVGKSMADSLGDVGVKIAEAMITGFTAGETAVKNFGESLNFLSTLVTLSTERIKNDIVYVFNEILSFGSWFGDSWQKLMSSLFLGGEQYTFEDVLKDLPKMGDRALTETEQALQAMLDESLGKLGAGFDEKVRERLEALKKAFQLDFKIELKQSEASKTALQDQLKELTAFESRVLIRGRTDSPIEKIAENTAKQVKEQEKTNKILEGIERSPQETLQVEIVR